MATEKGIVVKTDSGKAWVKTTRTGACEGCASRNSCHLSEGGQEMEVEALNDVGAKIGDHILLGIASTALFKVSFLLYIFPILLMLGGAVLGHQVAIVRGMDVSGVSALFGFLSFLMAFGLIRLRGKRMTRNQAYRPRIIKILKS